jgi:NAD(P)H-hydrate epimerase
MAQPFPRMNIPALSTAQMMEVDRLMIDRYHVTLSQMMENAGRNLAELARQRLGGQVIDQPLSVLCGGGNNGGGGMVAARHLHNMGAQVSVLLAADVHKLKDVPAHQWAILQAMHLDGAKFELESSVLILDALLGYGARGDPRPPVREWIERANASGEPILSLDSPSGLDTTTGNPGQPCIRATATMTLALPKMGLLAPSARQFVGELYLADIGVPPELYATPSLGLSVGLLFGDGPILRLNERIS